MCVCVCVSLFKLLSTLSVAVVDDDVGAILLLSATGLSNAFVSLQGLHLSKFIIVNARICHNFVTFSATQAKYATQAGHSG